VGFLFFTSYDSQGYVGVIRTAFTRGGKSLVFPSDYSLETNSQKTELPAVLLLHDVTVAAVVYLLHYRLATGDVCKRSSGHCLKNCVTYTQNRSHTTAVSAGCTVPALSRYVSMQLGIFRHSTGCRICAFTYDMNGHLIIVSEMFWKPETQDIAG
jgi:hypothetical protein